MYYHIAVIRNAISPLCFLLDTVILVNKFKTAQNENILSWIMLSDLSMEALKVEELET